MPFGSCQAGRIDADGHLPIAVSRPKASQIGSMRWRRSTPAKIIEPASKTAIAVFRLKLNWNAKPTRMQAATASKCGCPGESQGNRCGTDSARDALPPRSIHRRRGRFAASSRCRAASWLFPPARSPPASQRAALPPPIVVRACESCLSTVINPAAAGKRSVPFRRGKRAVCAKLFTKARSSSGDLLPSTNRATAPTCL